MESTHVVVIVGGAVAGSEATMQFREKGIRVILLEQNPLPFGKIEDGLPRWHVDQRQKEQEKICERLDHPLVTYVPKTKLGVDVAFDEIRKDWGVSAVLLANGAWKDRPLGMPGVDDYVGKGLVYQNPLVYWFNHYHEPNYDGPRYDIPDDTIVIGGGLASLDVMKICQIELVRKALKKRGIEVDMLTVEKEGIPKLLESHKLSWKDLGLKGTTLYYRRRAKDMPLADAPAGKVDPEKAGALREKILTNYATKFSFEMKDRHLPKAPVIENGRLVGLKFIRTEIIEGKVKELPGTDLEVRFNLAVSSIGSIPEGIPGLPQKGETYEVENLETGRFKGMPNVYALGNAVTGKGNIRVSLMHGRQVAQQVAQKLTETPASTINEDKLWARVRELQKKSGYDGRFKAWVEKQIAARG